MEKGDSEINPSSSSRGGIGRLLPRGPVYSLDPRPNLAVEDAIRRFPQITPPTHPSLCSSCSLISLDNLLQSRNKSFKNDQGEPTIAIGASKTRLPVDWPDPRASFGYCPMCRLLACDEIWDSGQSPYNQHFKSGNGTLQLHLEIKGETALMVWFPAQAGLKQDSAEIEVFAEHESYAAKTMVGRPWRGLTAPTTLSTIKERIGWCEDVHASCRKLLDGTNAEAEPVLPTRLLYVGSVMLPKLRLEKTDGRRGRYLALSHCWGAVLEAKTVLASVESHLNHINECDLSPMLQDVIKITRMLDHQYLWVDSLCIIQDDRGDWEREAAKMGSIYENAFLTIATTDGIDGNYRPLDDTYDVFKDDYVVGVPCDPMDPAKGSMFFRPRKSPIISTSRIDTAPLNGRAWVTQERILSRRTIHYTKGMIYYECDVIFDAANGNPVDVWIPAPLRVQLLTVTLESPITEDSYLHVHEEPPEQGDPLFWRMYMRLMYLWSDILGRYNTRKLTRQGDKLPAIEGLARRIQARTKQLYHCGLFFDRKEMIPRHLLWVPSQRDLWYKGEAPSWSWAAYDGTIEMWDDNPDLFDNSSWFPTLHGNYVASVKELWPAHKPSSEDDPTRFGAIIMEGRLKLARRSPSRDFDRMNAYADAETVEIPLHGWPRRYDCNERSYAIFEKARAGPHEHNPWKGWVCFDVDGEGYEPEMFCCLPIIKTIRAVHRTRNTAGNTTVCICWRILAVQRVRSPNARAGLDRMTFQRVGYGEVYGEHWFDDSLGERLLLA